MFNRHDDNAEIIFGNDIIQATIKTWQSNVYYENNIKLNTEYSGELEFNLKESIQLPEQTFGIYYCGKNYSAIAIAYSIINFNIITCRLRFSHGRAIDGDLAQPAKPNHAGGQSHVHFMSDGEIEDWLGWAKFVQASQRAEQLLSQPLEVISERLPLQNPADDLCALLRGIRPLALFDPEFLSFQPESLILYRNCIGRGYTTRFWKMGNRCMAGVGEESALREVESVKNEVTTCVKHLTHLFHLTTTQKKEFLNRHEPMGFNMTNQI